MGKKSKIKALLKKTANEESDEEEATVEESVEDGLSTPKRTKAPSSSRQLISEAVEKLAEKRYTSRENGWEQLIKHFQSSYESTAELSIEGYQDSIRTHLLRTIRRPPSVKEGKLCTHLISLLGLYLGADEVDFFTEVEKPLRQIVEGTRAELSELRGNSLSCLVFTAFICGGVDAGYKIWDLCGHILRGESTTTTAPSSPMRPGSGEREESDSDGGSSGTSDANSSADERGSAAQTLASRVALRCAAATSWVLLATLRSDGEVLVSCLGDGSCSSLLEPLLELLQYHDGANAGSIEVKITAGKCVAYLWEVAQRQAAGGSTPEEVGGLLCEDPSVVQQVLETIREIAKDSSKRISKKDRKEQRSEFRAIEDCICKNEAPEESLRMQGAVLEVAAFKDLHVVDALKSVLGTGFHSSLRLYGVVKEVLGIEYLTDAMDGAGQDLKVNKGSSTDKTRSNYRKQDRRFREMNTDFGDGDFGGFDD